MNRTLLACALVAVLEQPIGQSMDGFVIRYTINYCHDYAEPIQIIEEVLNGRTEKTVGQPRSNSYAIPPKPDEPATPPPTPTYP